MYKICDCERDPDTDVSMLSAQLAGGIYATFCMLVVVHCVDVRGQTLAQSLELVFMSLRTGN